MILGVFKISGHSMMPYLKPQEQVLASSIPYFFEKPKKGDVVIFKNGDKILIKRIAGISNDKIKVEGDNTKDSLKVGLQDKKNIKGKVILKLG